MACLRAAHMSEEQIKNRIENRGLGVGSQPRTVPCISTVEKVVLCRN